MNIANTIKARGNLLFQMMLAKQHAVSDSYTWASLANPDVHGVSYTFKDQSTINFTYRASHKVSVATSRRIAP